jgi:hypothetical protein
VFLNRLSSSHSYKSANVYRSRIVKFKGFFRCHIKYWHLVDIVGVDAPIQESENLPTRVDSPILYLKFPFVP